MANYREQYELAGSTYGIEDYEQPGKHFMPDLATHRFHCWLNGCGIGYHDTLQEARLHIFGYAIKRLGSEVRKITTRLTEIEEANDEIRRLHTYLLEVA